MQENRAVENHRGKANAGKQSGGRYKEENTAQIASSRREVDDEELAVLHVARRDKEAHEHGGEVKL